MIREKNCASCEYAYGWEEHCEKIHEGISEEDCCGCWEPKHGEWVMTSLCRPRDKELVLLPVGGRYEYRAEKDTFNDIDAANVRCWLRIPGASA